MIARAEPVVEIAPIVRAHIPTEQLLAHNAFVLMKDAELSDRALFWNLRCDGFHFEAGRDSEGVYVRRHGARLVAPIRLDAGETLVAVGMMLIWEGSEVRLYVTLHISIDGVIQDPRPASPTEGIIATAPEMLAPNRLLNHVRRLALLPSHLYVSEELFQSAILETVALLQSALDSGGAHALLWDIEKDGREIVAKKPKDEPNCQLWLRTQFYQASLTKNLTFTYEPDVGSGALDVLVTGVLADGTQVRACIEMKLAHSTALEHGLDVQLPEYMNRSGTDFGIYCVLYFRCERFPHPKESLVEVEALLKSPKRLLRTSKRPRVIIVDCSLRPTPSKMP